MIFGVENMAPGGEPFAPEVVAGVEVGEGGVSPPPGVVYFAKGEMKIDTLVAGQAFIGRPRLDGGELLVVKIGGPGRGQVVDGPGKLQIVGAAEAIHRLVEAGARQQHHAEAVQGVGPIGDHLQEVAVGGLGVGEAVQDVQGAP